MDPYPTEFPEDRLPLLPRVGYVVPQLGQDVCPPTDADDEEAS